MLGELDTVQIEEVLRSQVAGHLACCADGRPYIVPVSYAYDGTYIYMHTHEGKKMEMMRRNPAVCFQVDERKDMANWKSVIASGNFQELTTPEERTKGLQVLLNRSLPMVSSATTHLGAQWPFASDDLNTIEGIVFRIKLTEKSGRYEDSTHTPANAQ